MANLIQLCYRLVDIPNKKASNMLNFIKTRMNPTWYHGHGKQAPFFEGWYFKLINANQDKRFAFIPGIFLNKESSKTHAFIQVLNGEKSTATYHRFPTFYAKPNAFEVTIGQSHFTQESISLNIQDEIGSVKGQVHFQNLTPFPVTPLSPGIMGYFGWIPFMECNHGIVSLDHTLKGTLEIYGETVNFDGGRGYIEKDWGTNFPSGYVWLQTNHFSTIGTSLAGSIAVIPNFGRKFAGFFLAFYHEGQLYRFATYNGAKVDKLQVNETTVTWVTYTTTHEIIITAHRANGARLMSPEKDDMHKRVEETMQAVVHVQLNRLENGRKFRIFDGEGHNAGLEVVGNLEMLLKS